MTNIHRIRNRIIPWHQQCDGQTLVEYALILLVVVLVVLTVLATLGSTLIDTYYNQVISVFTGS